MILLENALRYGGSKIDVRLDRAPEGYLVAVSDNGPGMAEDEQARAFERFFRGSNAASRYGQGSGLGLPVAKAIVEAHGGKISLTSVPGQGLTVSFALPNRPPLKAVS
ncbi:MAG: sensor histidine kinase [Candidatus Competibacteraceae bacterium]|nr:sensor histidine kinase [Candidatus Competibacteraceae bacterium]